jgi:hypothetical protein
VYIPSKKTVRAADRNAFVIWACVALFPLAVQAGNCPPNARCSPAPPANLVRESCAQPVEMWPDVPGFTAK